MKRIWYAWLLHPHLSKISTGQVFVVERDGELPVEAIGISSQFLVRVLLTLGDVDESDLKKIFWATPWPEGEDSSPSPSRSKQQQDTLLPLRDFTRLLSEAYNTVDNSLKIFRLLEHVASHDESCVAEAAIKASRLTSNDDCFSRLRRQQLKREKYRAAFLRDEEFLWIRRRDYLLSQVRHTFDFHHALQNDERNLSLEEVDEVTAHQHHWDRVAWCVRLILHTHALKVCRPLPEVLVMPLPPGAAVDSTTPTDCQSTLGAWRWLQQCTASRTRRSLMQQAMLSTQNWETGCVADIRAVAWCLMQQAMDPAAMLSRHRWLSHALQWCWNVTEIAFIAMKWAWPPEGELLRLHVNAAPQCTHSPSTCSAIVRITSATAKAPESSIVRCTAQDCESPPPSKINTTALDSTNSRSRFEFQYAHIGKDLDTRIPLGDDPVQLQLSAPVTRLLASQLVDNARLTNDCLIGYDQAATKGNRLSQLRALSTSLTKPRPASAAAKLSCYESRRTQPKFSTASDVGQGPSFLVW